MTLNLVKTVYFILKKHTQMKDKMVMGKIFKKKLDCSGYIYSFASWALFKVEAFITDDIS